MPVATRSRLGPVFAVVVAVAALSACSDDSESPEFAATAAAENVEIVAVNVDRADVADGDLEAMLDRLDVDLPVWRDRAQTFLATYEGTMMPYSVLLDRDGAVAHSWVGSLDTDSDEFLAAVA